MAAKAIKLNCAADARLLSFMDPLDLSSLLGNLLDNAIEHVNHMHMKSVARSDLQTLMRQFFSCLPMT